MVAPMMNQVKPDLADVIAWIESRDNQYAFRFEPAVYGRRNHDNSLHQIMYLNGCSEDSARIIYSSSFGKYQIMGFNLYWPPICYMKTFGEFLASEVDQTQAFYTFVNARKIDYTVNQLTDEVFATNFALNYNGSVKYADAIAKSLAHFGVTKP